MLFINFSIYKSTIIYRKVYKQHDDEFFSIIVDLYIEKKRNIVVLFINFSIYKSTIIEKNSSCCL